MPTPPEPPEGAPPPGAPAAKGRGLLNLLFAEAAPLDLRILGRTLLHAAVVGAAAGLVGAMFLVALDVVEHFLLGELAGYVPLRADGEPPAIPTSAPFRPWLLALLPALGGLASGFLTARFAPEARGGGGDAMIDAFHREGGAIRRRLLWVKPLASVLTLGSGGAGGREGPTMQIGGALGSLVAGVLRVGVRERRILMIAGVAAGIAAVFRTPLGAALLAVEVLYRDDFESDALIPAVLASVVAYSVCISVHGESTLFAHAPRYPFVPAHLPLYGLLAVLVALLATLFVSVMRTVQRTAARSALPAWAKPAAGGLALGIFATPILLAVDRSFGTTGRGIGLFGGGYGAAQIAIVGAPWFPHGWRGVEFLLLLCAAKVVAASLTIGSGGSAGDFAPSLALGGLFGGAFGHAVALLLKDPRIDPGAFALVGMGTFYGGIAHVPLSSLVLVCELAGSYDLLVPLMLAEGIAFVALRRRTLYPAQVANKRESPAHGAASMDVLGQITVGDVMTHSRPYVSFRPNTPVVEILRLVGDTTWQDVFPVLDAADKIVGVVTAETLRVVATEREIEPWALAVDAMQPPLTVRREDDLRRATEEMLAQGLREVPVIDEDGKIVGFLDESDVGKAYLDATARGGERASSYG